MSEDLSTLLFVVAEPGSRWPEWLTHYQRVVPDVAVVAGDSSHTPGELAQRVAHRLQTVEMHEGRVKLAVILAGTLGSRDEVFQSRCLIAGRLLKHMSNTNRGKLVFAATERLLPEERLELMSLADTLTNQLVGTKLSIALRFEAAAEPKSGTHATSARIVEVA